MRLRITLIWLLLPVSILPADPAWWTTRGVKTSTPAANLAPATIGQAKHMAAMALAELNGKLPAVTHQALATDLAAIVDLTLPDPLPPGFHEQQRAVLLTGQLKAIAKPFYDHLRTHDPAWLDNAMQLAQIQVMEPGPPTPSPYPWTEAATDDANLAPATLGQLKAVFSLPLGTLPTADSDGDGLPDYWELYWDSEIAVFPTPLELDLDWGTQETRSLYLHNPTATAANYSVALTGETVSGYSWEDSQTGTIAYTWTDISTTGTALATIANIDNDSEKITLSQFAFPYYGRNHGEVWVCSNGYLNFKQEYNDSSNDELPDYYSPYGVIAPFWDDLHTGDGGDIYYKEEANRLIVQYEAVAKDDNSGANTFQIILNADSSIEFHYKQMDGDLDECSIGIQNVFRNQGIQLRYNTDASNLVSLQDSYAIRFNPTKTLFTLAPSSGSVASVTAAELIATFDSENVIPGTYTGSLSITHDGTGTSPWNVPVEVNIPYAKMTQPNSGYTLWEGETLSSTGAYLRAKVADTPDEIDFVEFRFGDTLIGTDSSASNDEYLSNWSNVPAGEHQVFTRVVLDNGQTNDSLPVLVDVTPDSDGDRMDDRWEQTHFGGIQEDPLDDFDSDGASNLHEYEADTNPDDNNDTPPNVPSIVVITDPVDAFTVLEGESIYLRSTVSDSDFGAEYVEFLADGLVVETDTSVSTIAWRYWYNAQVGTHLLTARATDRYGVVSTSAPITIIVIADSDGDKIPDVWELANNLNPNDAGDATADPDRDGYTNLEEYTRDEDPHTANLTDMDDDGIIDGIERNLVIPTGGSSYIPFNLGKLDTDNNGINDGLEDYDLDGLTTLEEITLGTNSNKADTDKDGVNDGKEIELGTNPLIHDAWFDAQGIARDSDGDGLSDVFEIMIGTNPFNADTNGNGMNDGDELDAGGSPSASGPAPPPVSPPVIGPTAPADPFPQPPTALVTAGFEILVESKNVSFPKHGFESFQTLDPPKRYLKRSSSQSFRGGCPESGPLGVTGQRSTTVNETTGEQTAVGDAFVNTGGDVQSPVRKAGSNNLSSYDDPPNSEGDCTGKVSYFTFLSDENTTPQMETNGKAELADFEGGEALQPGTPHAYRNTHANQLLFDYQKTQFKFKWDTETAAEDRHALTYLVVFTPEDDPDTTEDESEQKEITQTIQWDGQSEESTSYTLDPDTENSGKDGEYSLLPVEVAPDVLTVNSDFDEGRIDPATGYAIPDCDDTNIALEAQRDHLDGKFSINERITDDLHPGFFGVNPSQLDDAFWDGANVTIRKVDKTNPATGHPESGQIRLYGKWGDGASEYRAIVPYDFDTLVPENLATGGINLASGESVYGSASAFPEETDYFIEGVHPGKITLEWRYQKGSVDLKYEQEFEVCTHQNAIQWKSDLAYKIRLETSNDPSGEINTRLVMFPSESYRERMERASEYYDFYQDCFLTPMRSKPLHPQAMTWPGLARLAGSQVVGGLSDSEYARKLLKLGTIPGYVLPQSIEDDLLTWTLSETEDLQQALFTGARTIFQSIGWQMHAYRSSGYRALDWVETETGEAEVTALTGVWKDMRIGVLNHDKVLLDDVSLRITRREQNVTIVPTWNVISGLFAGTTEWMFSVLGENSCTPSGLKFSDLFPQLPTPTGSLANTVNRWDWIKPATPDGILDTWNKHPVATRDTLVARTLEYDARRFSLISHYPVPLIISPVLPVWVWDDEDVK